jgi:hypothetical protein
MTIDEFINQQFAMIAKLLPEAVARWPASFNCGWATGYKKALLDMDRFLEDKAEYEKMDR